MTSGSTPQRQIEDPGSAVPTHKVVVGIDGSPSSKEAMEFAAQEATRRGASLQVTRRQWPASHSLKSLLADY